MLIAQELTLDRALAIMADLGDAPRLCGSTLWSQAATRARGPQHLVGVSLQQGERVVGALVLAQDSANWRTGSPGQARLRWPFQELGYEFAPVFDPTWDAQGCDWLGALAELFAGQRLELRRCASDATPAAAGAQELSPGPAIFAADVEGDLQTWKDSLRGGHRRDFDYYRRRIAKLGGNFVDLQPGDDLYQFLDPCFSLHASRVADKGQTSLYLSDDGRAFLRQLASIAGAATRISWLQLDGDTIATCLAFVYRGHYTCFMPGWDPRRRSLDLGRQIIYQQILAEFDRDLRRIDLLGGDLSYKREFGLHPQPTSDLVVAPGHGARLRENLVHSAVELYRKLVRT